MQHGNAYNAVKAMKPFNEEWQNWDQIIQPALNVLTLLTVHQKGNQQDCSKSTIDKQITHINHEIGYQNGCMCTQ